MRFIFLRLKHLTWPEALYRLRQAVFLLCLKMSGKRPGMPMIDEGRLKSLAFPSIHGDVTDMEAPRTELCRETGPHDDGNDIRSLWEPARLQDVYRLLACAAGKTSTQIGMEARAAARQRVLSWIEENPFPDGPHYRSAMECGLRIPVFIRTLISLDSLTTGERQRIAAAIYEHAWLISRRMSLHSSLGNHTVCEGVGLIFAGALFRDDDEGARWLERGIRILDQEILRQILDDGGPLEQSSSYHRFIIDLYWLAAGFLEKNGLHDCDHWKGRLLAGEEFLGEFSGKQGEVPCVGDSDDGAAIAPGLVPERMITQGTCSAPRRSPEMGGHPSDEHTAPFTSLTFPHAGYTVIAGLEDIRLIFDHGPLGMPPLYNHGHADALSVILSKKGKPLLVDPGTFRYNGVPQWRRYFKGTRAHNTVTVDGLDQAVQETGFIWSHPYTVDGYSMSETRQGTVIRARHDGYERLKDPVLHTRSIGVEDGCLTIIDTFSGPGVHDFEVNFHLHPEAEISRKGSMWTIRNDGAECTVSLLGSDTLQLFCGQTDPPFGWYSPAYGKKVESGVLSCGKRGRPEEISFTTEIAV